MTTDATPADADANDDDDAVAAAADENADADSRTLGGKVPPPKMVAPPSLPTPLVEAGTGDDNPPGS